MAFLVDETRDTRCFVKAQKKGEPTFTLRAQDATAAQVIRVWLSMNPQLSEDRRQEVLGYIDLFEAWPTKKMPD